MSRVDCHCHIEFDEAISQSRLFLFSLSFLVLVSRFLDIGISLTYRLFFPPSRLPWMLGIHITSLHPPTTTQIYFSLYFLGKKPSQPLVCLGFYRNLYVAGCLEIYGNLHNHVWHLFIDAYKNILLHRIHAFPALLWLRFYNLFFFHCGQNAGQLNDFNMPIWLTFSALQ